MKTALTNEGKEIFIAKYFGQKVYKITNEALVNQTIDGFFLSKITGYPEAHLELTPLSLITDEDAIEVIGSKECNLKQNNVNDGCYGMSPSGIFVDSLINNDSFHIGKYEYQYLQSKGYALDYYCPIAKRIVTVEEQVEAGWITLKTE